MSALFSALVASLSTFPDGLGMSWPHVRRIGKSDALGGEVNPPKPDISSPLYSGRSFLVLLHFFLLVC